jgi:hypothetical protein
MAITRRERRKSTSWTHVDCALELSSIRHLQPDRLFTDHVKPAANVRAVHLCVHIQITLAKALGLSNPYNLKTNETIKMCQDPRT